VCVNEVVVTDIKKNHSGYGVEYYNFEVITNFWTKTIGGDNTVCSRSESAPYTYKNVKERRELIIKQILKEAESET
jgi:hypothetical protein